MKPVFEFNPAKVISERPLFDRVIEALSPQWGNARMEARVMRHLYDYQASQTTRTHKPVTRGVPSENARTATSRTAMMWDARDLVENFPPFKAYIRKLNTFTTPSEYVPATGDRDYDESAAAMFHDWCKRCDFTSRHTFKGLVGLAQENRGVDGDVLFVLRKTTDALKIELVAGDRLGTPNEGTLEENYFSGVIVDGYGRPTKYRVYRTTTWGQYVNPEDIDAASAFHFFDPFRVDQYRGVTDFHSVLKTARMVMDILEAEQTGVNFASRQAALIFNERGAAPRRNVFASDTEGVGKNGETPLEQETKVGTMTFLQRGDSVTVMPARPSSAFSGFIDALMDDIALGLGYPAGVLWGTGNYKGPSVRADFAQADRMFRRQQDLMAAKVLDPIKNAVLVDGLARGLIQPPKRKQGEDKFAQWARALRGDWRFPARLTIDVGRETDSNLQANRQGAMSLQEIASNENQDAFVRLRQIAQEAAFIHELSEEYGVPETAIRLPVQQIPQTVAGAGALGENAGAAAAAAQAASVGKSAAMHRITSILDGKTETKASRAAQKLDRANRLLESLKN